MDDGKEYFVTFEFKTFETEGVLPEDYCVAYDQHRIQGCRAFDYQPDALNGSLTINETEEKITVGNENFSSILDKRSGALTGLSLVGCNYM